MTCAVSQIPLKHLATYELALEFQSQLSLLNQDIEIVIVSENLKATTELPNNGKHARMHRNGN
jgi:hypothetical protein